jgi:hypothetical protein
VANRNRGRGGRSRKRRPVAARAAGEGAAEDASKRARPRAAARRSAGAHRDSASVGERPRAPWHPLPLSELLILVGAIGTVVGLNKGISHGGPALFTGIAAVLIGTVEVTLREHLAGYRSHTLMLALLPVVAFHVVVVLIVGALTAVPKELNAGLLLPDAALGTLLYRLLRARYLDARRERKFAGRR